jgi:cobalt-zinc-cadmium efflux system outer membrane protein
LYPSIQPLPPLPPPVPGPEGHPLSLADLQRLAETYSPTVKSALAAVEAAKGAAKQAGTYPNPTFFLEQDTVQTFQAGYQGAGADQVIKTMGKLKLQQAAAIMEVLNAQLALRRARADLRYNVRTAYFGVLVARENIKITDALFRFVNEIYTLQIELLEKGGFAAAYEPLQLRPLVLQAQVANLQARNQYQAAWRQLAAALGLPDMPPTEMDGRVDLPIPSFEYNEVLARLGNHTEVLTALNTLQRARYTLQLAKVTPIPDVDVHVLVQKDYSTPPFKLTHSLAVSMPVPIWDQNKGNIHQAEALLAQASVGPDQARNSLIATLADAYNRYATGRRSVQITAQQVEDQVRAFRSIYLRRQQLPAESHGDVSFGDVVTAQQTLVTYVGSYVTALGQQWQAVVDVANLLQTDDLFQSGRLEEVPPVPCLEELIAPWGHRKGLSRPATPPAQQPAAGSLPWMAPHAGEQSEGAATPPGTEAQLEAPSTLRPAPRADLAEGAAPKMGASPQIAPTAR